MRLGNMWQILNSFTVVLLLTIKQNEREREKMKSFWYRSREKRKEIDPEFVLNNIEPRYI